MTSERAVAKRDNAKTIFGLTRAEMIAYLQSRDEERINRPAFLRYLYDVDDWLDEGALITENTPRMVMTKVRLKLVLAAQNPKRTKPLVQIFLEEYNREMVGLARQGRQEALGALQSLIAAAEEGAAISVGGP